MTTDLAIPESPAALDNVSDPGAMMIALVEQAKVLLLQASGIEGIAVALETKSRAEAIETYVQQKNMGHDAELAAGEIVRRAERRIATLIREGQAEDLILRQGQTLRRPGHLVADGNKMSAGELVGATHRTAISRFYPLTDNISDDQFETALTEAKAEGNLSRKNVVRKIIGAPKPAPIADRHELLYKTRRFDSVRFVRETVRLAPDMSPTLSQVDWTALDLDDVAEWISSLDSSIRFLTTLKKNLKELIHD